MGPSVGPRGATGQQRGRAPRPQRHMGSGGVPGAGAASGRPDFESAGAYFAAVAAGASSEVRRAVRDRGAGVGRARASRRYCAAPRRAWAGSRRIWCHCQPII